jgi:hypothetical protein
LAATAAVAATTAVVVAPAPAGAATGTPVLGRKVIGYSVKHRPIVAYHLGNPQARTTAVLLGQMHGDEHAGVVVARSLVRGRTSVEGINLWVVPTMNPDGDAVRRRQNAHKVDLNRNWPRRWTELTGMYYSGRKPLSEPETRAMYSFLRSVRPRYLVSLHQPLSGVDTTDGGALDKAFRNRLARNLGMARKAFRCWSTCHGSMTDWYTTRRYGIGITVEFGWHPARSYLVGKARRGIVAAMGGRFGSLAAHNPRRSVTVTQTAAATDPPPGDEASDTASLRWRGYAYDVDARAKSLRYAVSLDGKSRATGRADRPSAAVNRRFRLTGAHAFAGTLSAEPGRHTLCLTFVNVGAGTGDSRSCAAVTVAAP